MLFALVRFRPRIRTGFIRGIGGRFVGVCGGGGGDALLIHGLRQRPIDGGHAVGDLGAVQSEESARARKRDFNVRVDSHWGQKHDNWKSR